MPQTRHVHARSATCHLPRATQARALLPDPKLVSDKRERAAWIHHTSMLYVVDPGEGEGEGEGDGGTGEGRRAGLGSSLDQDQGRGQAAGVGLLGAVPVQGKGEAEAGGPQPFGAPPQPEQQQLQQLVWGADHGGGTVPGLPESSSAEVPVRQDYGLSYGGRRKRREVSTTAAATVAGALAPLTSLTHTGAAVAGGCGGSGCGLETAAVRQHPRAFHALLGTVGGAGGQLAGQDPQHQRQQFPQQQERQGYGAAAGMDVDAGGATVTALGVLGAAAAALAGLDPRDPRRRQLRRSVEQNAVAAFLGAVARGDLQVGVNVYDSSLCAGT